MAKLKFKVTTYTRRAYRKKKDLTKFLRRLAKSTGPILKTVAEVDKEVWEEVACLDCANCCKKMTPTYTRKDINRIAAHLKMTYQEYYEKYLKVDENKDIINKSTPCQFLGKNHKCTIYDIRPDDCAMFPHFIRKDFRYQVKEKTFQNNLTYCPATLVFVEKLQARIEGDR